MSRITNVNTNVNTNVDTKITAGESILLTFFSFRNDSRLRSLT